MKKLIFLFLFSILFQSCFSYKTVDFNNIAIEKKQNFELEKLDSSELTGRLVSKNEKIIVLENNRGLQTILKSEIQEVKVRKFSILKSVGTAGSIYFVAVAAILVISLSALGN